MSFKPERNHLDRYYRQNVIGVSGAEFFWGLGLPVVVESTFLQLFLTHMGASSFAVGLIPFFFFVGTSVFALFSSYYTANLSYQRTPVIMLHLVSSLSLLLFGISLLFFGDASFILVLFFCCYAVFSICIGITLPVWLNYLVKIFSEEKSVSGLGFMIIAQSLGKLISSLLIVRMVERYAFSAVPAAIAFILVGTLFALGSLCFILTREMAARNSTNTKKRPTFIRYVRQTFGQMANNRNFLWYLAGDLEFYIVVTIISFYANYATLFCGIAPAMAAGAFVACLYFGAIITTIIVGTQDMGSLKQKSIASRICSFCAALLLVFFCTDAGFYAASFLLGASRSIRMIVLAPAVKKLSGQEDATGYFAVAPLFSLPFATFLPLAFGAFLDHFPALGGDAYRILFALSGVLIVITFLCTLKTDFTGPLEKNTKIAPYKKSQTA
jgi:hypothetical protein